MYFDGHENFLKFFRFWRRVYILTAKPRNQPAREGCMFRWVIKHQLAGGSTGRKKRPMCGLTAASRTPPWLPSDGGRRRHRRKANPPQQALETLVVAQDVHARIYMKIDKPVGMLLIAFLQVFNRAVVLSQANVDSGEGIGRDILVLR